MITIQKISVQGNSNLAISGEQKIQLNNGDNLLVEHAGVKTLRSGADLILLIPSGETDTNGQAINVKVWVQGFFNRTQATQVVVTSPDEPVQLITPESASQMEDIQNAQAADTNGNLEALSNDSSYVQSFNAQDIATSSTSINLIELNAQNESSVIDFQQNFIKGNDASISILLPGINPPGVPTLKLGSSGLRDPFGKGVVGVNKQMAISGYSVQGIADRNNEVTVVLESELTKNTALFTSRADGSGKYTIPLTYASLKGIAEGYYTVNAYATDSLKSISPQSKQEKLYIDVKSPDVVKMNWENSDINLSNDYINLSKIGESNTFCMLRGTAEANSTVKFFITDKNGRQNPGADITYSCKADANGYWEWALTQPMLDLMAQGVLSIRVTATDAMENESNALVFGSVGFDLIAPVTPEFKINLNSLAQADGQYLTLNKSSLGTDVITNQTNKTFEKDGKVQVRFISSNNGIKLFDPVDINEQGEWSKQFTISQLAGLAQGVYKVSIQGSDATGNKSAWSDEQTVFVDVSPPDAPFIHITPTANRSVDVDGVSLEVVNIAAKNDVTKKFKGTSEKLSTVILTLFDAGVPNYVKTYTTTTDTNGDWQIGINSSDWNSFKQGVIYFKVQSIDLSGNSSQSSDVERIFLDITAPQDPSVQLGKEITQRTNANKPNIRFLNFKDFESGKLITGTGERDSTITLTVIDESNNTVTLSNTIKVNSSGVWQYTLTSNDVSRFGNGVIVIKAFSTDAAGNTSQTVTYNDYVIEKHTDAPAAPTDAGLASGQDTYSPDSTTSTDKKTKFSSPVLSWKISAGLKTYIWADTDKNGLISESEKSLNPVDSTNIVGQTDVTYTVNPVADGDYDYFVVSQDEWGNFSAPTKIHFTRDTQLNNPRFAGFKGDNNLSYQEYLERADIILKGTVSEEDCYVTIKLLDINNQIKKTAQVKAIGFDWSIDKFFDRLVLDANGSYTLEISAIDAAGNSTENAPLTVHMNIRSSPLNDVAQVQLSAASDSSNARDGTGSDNITKVLSPEITGHVDYDPNAETIVILKNSKGVTLAESAVIGVDGNFKFNLQASWLSENADTKFTLSSFDRKTGTPGNVPKDFIVTLDTQYENNQFGIQPVTDDNLINYAEFNATTKPKIEGTSEINSEISVELSRFNGTELRKVVVDTSKITYTIDGNIEKWSMDFTEAIGNYLGNGDISITVTAKDRAGNIYISDPQTFKLNRGQLISPDTLDLINTDDTGTSNIDNKTQGTDVGGNLHKIKVTGNTRTSSNVTVTIWNDANENYKYDDGEKLAEIGVANPGTFEQELMLSDGKYNIYNFYVDSVSRLSSSSSDPLTVFIDNTALNPTDISLGINSKINFLNYDQENASISGKGEKDATVFINFALESTPGTRMLTGKGWNCSVNSDGKWNINLSQTLLNSLQEGKLLAYIKQADLAGNTSGEVTVNFEYDKSPPSAPDAITVQSALDNYGIKPWEDVNGIEWSDLYSYDASTQISIAKTLRLAVALPTNGSLIQPNDTVKLFWGQTALNSQNITQQDIDRGYVLVDVGADVISNEGKNSSLSVKAYYTDTLNNKSSEFNVLSNINISLNAKAPSVNLSKFSSQNKAVSTQADSTWYTNKLTNFEINGLSDRGSTVKLYATKVSDGSSFVIGTTTADSVTGNYSFVISNMKSLFTAQTTYLIQADSTLAGKTSFKSDAIGLNVFSGSVPLPLVDNSEILSTDNYINSSERDAGVAISGRGAPAYAKIQIKLTNDDTKVSYDLDPFYALQDGTWSHNFSMLDWGGVGEGKIIVAISQTNVYGDSSGFKTLTPTYIYDATVLAPVVFSVTSDNYINQSEYQSLSSTVIQLAGTGEPGSNLTVKLTGSNGQIYEKTNITVGSDKSWVIALTQSMINSFGEGKVSIEAYQVDKAGNKSVTTKNTFFNIDFTADNLVLKTVALDDIINPVEKDAGVLLSGSAEVGAKVEISLSKTGYVSKVLPTFQSIGANWTYTLKSSDIDSFGNGLFTISIKETDLAGNVSVVSKTVEMQTGQLGTVTLSTLSEGQSISLAEQSSDMVLRGTGPIGSQIQLEFKKPDGTAKKYAVSVDSLGKWVFILSPDMMVSLQGEETLRFWAVSGSQTSAIQSVRLVFDSNFATPVVNDIAQDNVVNKSEIANDQNNEYILIQGSGENNSTVNLIFKGSTNAASISRSADVTDKKWSVKLTKTELTALTNGNGTINYTLVQTDQISGNTSITLNKSFTVDLLPPALPVGSELNAAQNFNNVNSKNSSSAADKLVSDIEARAGVDIAVPIAKSGGNFVMSPGEKISLIWGMGTDEQIYEKTLTENDFVAGKDYVTVKVPLEVIAKYGQNSNLSVGVKYTDKAGNTSDTLTLITGLVVNPPPDAPTVNALSGDGFLNQSELSEINSDTVFLKISGSSKDKTGKVNLIIYALNDQTTALKTINDISIDASGNWAADLKGSLINSWADGQYVLIATYSINGRSSNPTKSLFELDRILPNAPTTANINQANIDNSISELGGGLTRPWINGNGPNGTSAQTDRYSLDTQTEALNDVNVRVALPGNIKVGDVVQLTWGAAKPNTVNTVVQAVTNSDIAKGVLTVKVLSSLITDMGDDNNLSIKAKFIDSAGNSGTEFDVVRGKVVDAAPVPVKNISSSFGDWLNLTESNSNWSIYGECDSNAEIEMVMRGSSGYSTTPIRLWKSNAGAYLFSNGTWRISRDDINIANLVSLLGEGMVNVSIVQRDQTGNPSKSVDFNFRVDLTPPDSPLVDLSVKNKLTFSTYASGKTISGDNDSNAKVFVFYELLNPDNTVAFTTTTKEAVVNGMRWNDVVDQLTLDNLLTRYAAGTTGGKVRVNVFQTDQADNKSTIKQEMFSFESKQLNSPTWVSVDGLDIANAISTDTVISDMDFVSNQITVRGTASESGLKIHMVLSKNNLPVQAWDIVVGSSLDWSQTISKNLFSSDTKYSLSITAQKFDASGMLDNESVVKKLTFNNGSQDYFTVDTHGPVLQSKEIVTDTLSGNAKSSDKVKVILTFSEKILADPANTESPDLILTGFNDGADRHASYIGTDLANPNQLIFEYTVVDGDDANSGSISVKSIDWKTTVFKDSYGNVKQADPTLPTSAHSILIDTVAPTATVSVSSVSGTDAASPGADFINISESNTVNIRVSLSSDVEVGNDLNVKWGDIKTFVLKISELDKTRGWIDVSVDSVSVLGHEESIDVKSWITDPAKNKSADSSPVTVKLDTVKPPLLNVDLWLIDNLVSETEFNAAFLPDITGSGVQAGSTLTAKFLYTLNGIRSSKTLTVQQSSDPTTWSITGSEIKAFLQNTFTYGVFDLQVWQTDARGNDSDIQTQSYFIDAETPNPPSTVEIAATTDGWINANQANNMDIKISFDSNRAPKAGDSMAVKFWKYSYGNSNYATGQTADFERKGILITADDIRNGYRIINISDPKMLQDPTSSVPQEIKYEVVITDQGGNASVPQTQTSHLDTNIKTPTVSNESGTVVNNVTPTQAQADMHFKGGNIEILQGSSSQTTNVMINFTSKYAKISLDHVAYSLTDGSFDVVLTNSDFRTLVGNNNEALVYYEVFQIDKAGNVSNKAVDSFNVALSISPPVVQNFSGDNILSNNDLTATQTLSGVSVPKTDITVKLFVVDNASVATEISSLQKFISSSENTSGSWSINYAVADLSSLTAGRSTNFTAYFEVTASQNDQQSNATKVDFEVYRQVPSTPTITKFDSNGDGANNDGLEILFDDFVRVSDMLKELNAYCGSSSRRNIWGSNFKIEAKDGVKISGDLYAKTFRISLGADRNIATNTPIVIRKSSIVNKANNQPSVDVTLAVPDLFVQIPINTDSLWFGDNIVNSIENSRTNTVKFYLYDNTPAFKPRLTDLYTIYLDGKVISAYTSKSIIDFSNLSSSNWISVTPTLNVTLGSSGTIPINTSRQGIHTITTQITSDNTGSNTGFYSVPHSFIVDTVVDTAVKKVVVTNHTGPSETFNPGDTIRIEFSEALTLGASDLSTAIFGSGASARPVGGYYKPISMEIINGTSYASSSTATDAKNASMKSSVWEITVGTGATLTKGSDITFTGLNDVAENNSSSITAHVSDDIFDTPIGAYIDVVSTDNVISSSDISGLVKVTVKLSGSKVGDVVKLFIDGVDATNLIKDRSDNANPKDFVTVVSPGSVDIYVDPKDFGGDGLRHLVATVQRPGGTSVIQSDARDVYVSENSTHWSGTGDMIWFDTDNIVQDTGSYVSQWKSSVGGSTAISVGAPTLANPSSSNVKPVLIRNSVNGHNQLFFNGSDFQWDAAQKKWVSTPSVNGKVTGTYMYFDDPTHIFANVTKTTADSVATKIPYTVIANGRKDTRFVDSFLTSIGANGSNDNSLATGNVGLAYWGGDTLDAFQGANAVGNPYFNISVNRPSYAANYSWLAPGIQADLGFNPLRGGYNLGMVAPTNSGTLGMQLLLSHTYNTQPIGNNTVGDVYLYSNGELIGHRTTDYKITLGGGRVYGSSTTEDNAFQAITKNQFLIGAMNQANTTIPDDTSLGKNVANLWHGMIGDIIWSAKTLSGAYLQEINTYQAVKFATIGYFVPAQASSQNYDLSVSADKMNLLDDVLLLNQMGNAANGAQVVTVAGADFVNTGNGSDTFVLKDLKFRYLDGGKDEDTLKLASDYSGSNTIYLSDFVSNSRGDSADTSASFVDNVRVNVNGFHKLAGIENIDLSTHTGAQTLLLSDKDVYQLSDTHSLKIEMDSNDVLLVNNMNTKNNGHYYKASNNAWYDFYYAQDFSSIYTQGGDKIAGIKNFDLSNSNSILSLYFDHALKTSDGSDLSPSKFTVSGLGSYVFNSSNFTGVSFFNQQQSIRFTSSTAIKGPISITYADSTTQLKDAQGRDLPSMTWMIGSDLADFDSGANYVLNASNKVKPVIILGGSGEDQLTGSNYDDTLVGGNDSDTLFGGLGSDTFVFFKETSTSTVSNIAGTAGDVISDFGFGKNGPNNADTIKLDHLFSNAVVSSLGRGAAADATTLSSFLKFEWTHDSNNLQLVCSADLDGGSQFSKLFTMANLQDAVVNGSYNPSQPDLSRLSGVETTSNAILQKLLEEGRLVIQ